MRRFSCLICVRLLTVCLSVCCAYAGKTLLARALANNIKASYLKVVASAIVDKYIGESARIIREMFGYAKDHQPCVIFMVRRHKAKARAAWSPRVCPRC